MAVMRHGDAALAELTQFAAAHLMEPAALINRQRIQNFRKRYLRRVANKGGDTEMKPLRGVHAGEPRAIKGALHHNLSENRELEAPHEYRGAFGIASQSEAKAAVSIKIRTEQGSHDASWHEGTLTASLLLDLENTGVIEILLTLGEDQIWVDFRTATPHTRQRIEAELDGVHASLTALARRVYCRVRSDQQLTAPDLGAGAALCGPREIDLKI